MKPVNIEFVAARRQYGSGNSARFMLTGSIRNTGDGTERHVCITSSTHPITQIFVFASVDIDSAISGAVRENHHELSHDFIHDQCRTQLIMHVKKSISRRELSNIEVSNLEDMNQHMLAEPGRDDWVDSNGHSLWKPTAFPDWLDNDSETVARKLLGCYLVRDLPDTDIRVVVRIVETEAYDQDDPASHAYHGKSQRNRVLFGPSGHCYVYFTYGMWHCLNIACSANGYGAGALIRAVEPVVGSDCLEHKRGTDVTATGKPAALSRRVQTLNGPAKLTTALDIDKRLYDHDLRKPPLQLMEGKLREGERVESTIRIGISKAVERKRRFIVEGNPWVSKMPTKTRHIVTTPL